MDTFLLFLMVGLLAQAVDGALGMAYGVISSSVLLAFGVPPATASASVHAAEVFTTAASAGSHAWHRNVDWRLLAPLAVAGVIGGVVGAYVLTGIKGDVIKPFVVAYLAGIGAWILWRAGHAPRPRRLPSWAMGPMGLIGGFLDAAGGGGWGPVVTSNLLVQGATPRTTIGTVNTVEFFLTATVSAAFIANLGWAAFTLQTVGILIGGLIAAPFGGLLAKRVPTRALMTLVGVLLTITSAWSIYLALTH